MKKTAGYLTLGVLTILGLTGCAGWDTIATVGGGSGWYAGDYAPYYWSDYNTPSNPPIVGNGPGSIVNSGWGNVPNNPPVVGNGPGSMRPAPGNPGAPNNPNGPGNPGNPGYAPGNPGGNQPNNPPSVGNGPGSNPGTPAQGGFRGQK